MATKNKKGTTSIIGSTAKTLLGLANKTNDFALTTTEKVFTRSFSLVEKGMGFSNKMVKRGLQISGAQQDSVFNVLESVKGKVVKTSKKSK